MSPELGFAVFLATIAIGVAATAPGYYRLFALLESEAPATWQALGRPGLLNRSPTKSLAVQRFLYDRRRQQLLPEAIRTLCRRLAWLTPLLVAAVALQIVYWLWHASVLLGG